MCPEGAQARTYQIFRNFCGLTAWVGHASSHIMRGFCLQSLSDRMGGTVLSPSSATNLLIGQTGILTYRRKGPLSWVTQVGSEFSQCPSLSSWRSFGLPESLSEWHQDPLRLRWRHEQRVAHIPLSPHNYSHTWPGITNQSQQCFPLSQTWPQSPLLESTY